MKAVVVTKPGVYEIREVDKPVINEGYVLIKVKYAALCYRDLLQLRGYYPRMRYPVILGHEAVGIVVDSRDPRFKPGDRVVPLLIEPDGTCQFCSRGLEAYCTNGVSYGEEVDGFFAEYARVSGNALVKVPNDVPDEVAVLTPCVLAMVYKGLKRAGLEPGETVVITGASGGVGIHAIQVAKALGARVIGVTRSEVKAGVVRKFADHVIVGARFSDEVKRLTGAGADLVIEAVGTPTLNESLKSLRIGGRVVLIGNVNPDEAFSLRLGYAILKDIEIIGNVRSNRSDITELFRLAGLGLVKPVVAGVYSIDEFGEALSQLSDNSSRVGKVLIKI
ncbi:acryloyl-coenzyme A reductase [Vulcanisaeta thermophila]|uniref:acryloyl-coenzyme A reductase n=1 Tax=Vulcanisaeta thermophila TaxID=867917 RepID=UPI000852A574|nr:acryloyl-coenzyme A reductase [Vulcanisaeta thermophila]